MQRVVRSTLVGLLTLAGLTACGDKVTVPPVTTTPQGTVVHSVTVSPNSLNLKVGDKITLAVSVDADAGVTNRTVTWKSSNTAVATVDNTGTVTAVTGGTATIVATSAQDPTVSGAAVVTVANTVPASVTIGQINQTVCVVGGACTSLPANLSNVANQLDVTLNVDPGTQTLAGVDLIMNCGGADTVVATQNIGAGDKAPVAEESNAPVTLSFNTAAFTAATGAVAFKNGQCTIKARARTTAGTQVASTTQTLTLNNADVVNVTTTTTPSTGQNASAAGANGLVWRAGAVNVTAIPVMYSGGTIASGTVSLVNGASAAHNPTQYGQNGVLVPSGQPVATLANVTPTSGVITVTFPNSTSATGGVGGASVDSLFTVVTTVASTGNAGPTVTLPVAPTPAAAFIRLDNKAPDVATVAPTVNFNVQNAQNGWVGTAFVFSTSGSSKAITLDAATTQADWGGVDVVKVNTQFRAAGSGASFVTFAKTTDLTETASATAYELRLQVCDALNNCVNSTPAGNLFVVDLTAPTLTQVGGVKDGTIYSAANPIPATVDFSVFDPVGAGGVSGSGTSVNGLLVKDQGLQPNGIPGSKTVCAIGNPTGSGSSITCASGVLQPNTITLPAAAKADGEYTMTVQAADQAGNLSASQTIKYYTDVTSPTIAPQGVAIPNPITAGSSFSGFAATDNMDVKAGYGSLVFTAPAVSFAEGGTASPAGAAFDNVLTQQSTVGTTLGVFYKSLTNAVGTIGSLPASVNINVVDVAGNLSGAPLSTALPAANVGAAPTTAFNAGSNAITAFSIDSTSSSGSANLNVKANSAITLYVNATPASDLTGNPLSQVCFFYQVTSNNQFGSGAAAGDWVKLGCTGGAGTVGVGATRRFFYSFTTTFPAAFNNPTAGGSTTIPVVAIGNTSTLDGIMSAPVSIVINTPP